MRRDLYPLIANYGMIRLKPLLISHESYQDSVLLRLRQHYSGGVFVIANKDWPLVVKFWRTDLSYITTLLQDDYAAKGPQPRDPASMLRSYLLFLMTKPEIGITEWINEMQRIPYYAILSGFEPGDFPGVGTFYDFFKRLWAATIVTSSLPRSKSTCQCRAQGLADCNHPSIYSQPDCNSGWDSSREKYFNCYQNSLPF